MNSTTTKTVKLGDKLILIGSKFSPFVRRIKLQLQQHPYEEVNLELFSPEAQEFVAQYSPIRRIPIFVTWQGPIFDSRQIGAWIRREIYKDTTIDLNVENFLTLVDEATDGALMLLQNQRFALDPLEKNFVITNHKKRLEDILKHLDQLQLTLPHYFNEWNQGSQWLYCLLDWIAFRKIINIDSLELGQGFKSFMERFKNIKEVMKTDPHQLT